MIKYSNLRLIMLSGKVQNVVLQKTLHGLQSSSLPRQSSVRKRSSPEPVRPRQNAPDPAKSIISRAACAVCFTKEQTQDGDSRITAKSQETNITATAFKFYHSTTSSLYQQPSPLSSLWGRFSKVKVRHDCKWVISLLSLTHAVFNCSNT